MRYKLSQQKSMKCIFCKIDKSPEEFNKEHIFPESIGGTITLDCICISCNSKLGAKVDSPLVNHMFVQGIRLALGIAGKSGKIPNPLKEGSIDGNKKIRYIFDDFGKPKELYIFDHASTKCGVGNQIPPNPRLSC